MNFTAVVNAASFLIGGFLISYSLGWTAAFGICLVALACAPGTNFITKS